MRGLAIGHDGSMGALLIGTLIAVLIVALLLVVIDQVLMRRK